MARFDSLMKATFNPPRNWTLLEDLKFYSDEITEEDAKMLRECGVKVHNSTRSDQYIVTIPKGYVTDMASVPRGCWAFIAPFDVARAAVVHDILYEKINTQYKTILDSAALATSNGAINAQQPLGTDAISVTYPFGIVTMYWSLLVEL
jgi:hypothetical protein